MSFYETVILICKNVPVDKYAEEVEIHVRIWNVVCDHLGRINTRDQQIVYTATTSRPLLRPK